jgi:uncharacterized protein (UPF0332 family)
VTDDNRKANVADELARARQALAAGDALLSLGLYADAVSRAYYAIYHLLRALLYTRGLEPKSHGGAIHLFNTEFVRTGVFPTSHNRLIAGAQRARELADYDAAVTFGEEDASALIADARTFEASVAAHLRAEGFV